MPTPLSPSYGDKNTISGWRCRLLGVPAWLSAVSSVVVASACRRGWLSSSSGHRLSAACLPPPMPFASVCGAVGCGGLLLSLCPFAGVVLLAVLPGRVGWWRFRPSWCLVPRGVLRACLPCDAFRCRIARAPRLIDMPGGASPYVVVCCSWLVLFRACPVVRGSVVSREVTVSFLLCLPRACLSCRCFSLFLRRVVCLLIPFRHIVVSPWLPAVSTSGAGRGGLRLGLGSSLVAVACCLPWRGRGCGVAVRFPSLFACPWSPVDGGVVISVVSVACRWSCSRVGMSRSFRPILVACLLGAFSLSPAAVGRLVCFVFVVVGRHGLFVVGCCRPWFLLVVGRRLPVVVVLLALGCRRRPCSPRVGFVRCLSPRRSLRSLRSCLPWLSSS